MNAERSEGGADTPERRSSTTATKIACSVVPGQQPSSQSKVLFQSVLESLPGVDPQSDAVRQAVGAMSGQSKDSKKKDEDKKNDQAKK